MAKTIATLPVESDALPIQPTQQLNHLPGPTGHWLTGNLPKLTPNPMPYLSSLQRQYGDCFTVGFFFNRRATLMVGPQANKLLLLDPQHNFSSKWGWTVLHPFFGRNLLVRDFADHRAHRRLMTQVFKTDALARYLEQIQPIVDRAVQNLTGPVDVYPMAKGLALKIAIAVFAGIDSDSEATRWNRDLTAILSNVMAHRIPLPGTPYWRALQGRNRLRQRLTKEIAKRRGQSGHDLFSQLVNQRDSDDAELTDEDVVDHTLGLLFAAHDTTASSLALMFSLLASHPQWQDKARQECLALYETKRSLELEPSDLSELPTLEAIFNETLRMYAPIQFIPRRNLRPFEFRGHLIPANTWLLLATQVTHFCSDVYDEPERFNPGRFLDPAQTRPPFSFIPFGKGSHMCLGMHFAYMEIKAVLFRVLLSRTLLPAGHDATNLQYLPIVKPTEPLFVDFVPMGLR